MEKVGLSKKKLAVMGTVVVFAVSGVGIGLKVNADNQYKEKIGQALQATNSVDKEIDTLEKELLAFYEGDDQEFLVKDLSVAELNSLKESIDKVVLPKYEVSSKELTSKLVRTKSEKESVVDNFVTIKGKLDQQELLNSFFQKDKAINGSNVTTDLVIIDDLKKDQLFSLSEEDKGVRAEAIKKVLKNATDQLDQIKKTSEQIDKFFKDNKVIDPVDDKALKIAQDDAKKIKNEKACKAQEARLKQVTDEVAKRKAAEDKVKAEAVQTTVADPTNNTASATTSGPTTGQQAESYSGGVNNPVTYNDNGYSGGGNTGGGYTGGGNQGGGSSGGTSTGGGNQGGGSTGGTSTGGGAQGGGSTTGGGNQGGGSTGGGNTGGGTVVKPNENGGEDIYEGWD